jgi:hypothetical protein
MRAIALVALVALAACGPGGYDAGGASASLPIPMLHLIATDGSSVDIDLRSQQDASCNTDEAHFVVCAEKTALEKSAAHDLACAGPFRHRNGSIGRSNVYVVDGCGHRATYLLADDTYTGFSQISPGTKRLLLIGRVEVGPN